MSMHDQTPGSWPTLDALVTEMVNTRKAIAALQARESQLLAEAVDVALTRTAILRGEGRRAGADLPMREVSAELGAAMRLSDRAVQTRMGDAAMLTVRFTATLAAWTEGRIDAGHVSAILDAGSAIENDEARAQFEKLTLDIAERETPARTKAHARAVAAQLDPEAAARRARRAIDVRGIRVVDLDDNMSRLLADLPTTLAHAIGDRLTQMGRDVRGAELAAAASAEGSDDFETIDSAENSEPMTKDPHPEDSDSDDSQRCLTTEPSADAPHPGVRTLDQVRADVFADLLLAGAPSAHGDGDALGAITAHVQITVPALSLMGHDAGPALLAGSGPIDIETAKRLAADAPGWDRVLTDPHCGGVLAVDRYRPTAELRRFLAARDEHCRFPGCRRPARRTEIDHTWDAAKGGETSERNLAHFCTRHHTLKHATAWTVKRVGPGVLEWKSSTGRRYEDRPPAVVRFVPTDWLERVAALPEHPPF
ncbi:HNH endonuclease [Microbacterium lacus]|uniref:HNH endonuclease n=1 Tax=Microbacterium lacus TaxID=415217 RepID=UPI00384A47FF